MKTIVTYYFINKCIRKEAFLFCFVGERRAVGDCDELTASD